jgi:hypothetical protein
MNFAKFLKKKKEKVTKERRKKARMTTLAVGLQLCSS